MHVVYDVLLPLSHFQLTLHRSCASSLTWLAMYPRAITMVPPFWFSAATSFRTGNYTEADEVGPHHRVHKLEAFMFSAQSTLQTKDLNFFSLAAPGLWLKKNLLELSLD